MRLINQYIFKQIVVGYAIVLISLSALIWLTQSLKMIDLVVSQGAGIGAFLEMSLWALPSFVQVISPLAFFAVILFVLTRMQGDKELMVIQAAGISPQQIMKPILVFGVILTIVGYVFSFYLIPHSNQSLREMKFQIRNKISHVLLQEGQFNTLKKGLTIYIRERSDGGLLKDILVYETQKKGVTSSIVAKEGIVYKDIGGLKVQLKDGSRQEWEADKNHFSILKFKDYVMAFNQTVEGEHQQKAKELSSWDLLIVSKKQAGSLSNFRKLKVEIAKRIILPLYHFSFMFLALFGIFSGFYNRRGQTGRVQLVIWWALLFQSMGLLFENLSGKNLWCLSFLVLNMILPVIFVYGRVIREKGAYLALLLFGLLCVGPVQAVPSISAPHVDKNKPVDFESDFISYDQNTNTMKAWGNVVIKQNDLTIYTPELLYNKQTGQIELPQKSKVVSGETTTYMDSAVLQGDLRQAVGKGIEVYTTDNTVMKSRQLKRTREGQISYLSDISYTPCELCEGKPPFWQLKAKKMKQDNSAKTMEFYHTLLEIKDVPVFYFPFLKMPDFSVKRKTGFLMPSFTHSSILGTGIEAPFFVDVADNQNLLIRPTITNLHAPLVIADYQGIFKNAKVSLQASETEDKHSHDDEGHVKLNGEYVFSDKFKIDGQLFRVSNDTYFRRYSIPGVDDQQSYLTSHLTGTYLGSQSYGKLGVLKFQSLQTGVDDDTLPMGLPVGNFYYQTDKLTPSGLYAFSDLNTAFLETGEDFRSDRLSYTQGLHLPSIFSSGLLLDTIATVRVDGYSIDTGDAAGYARANHSYETGRIYPNFSIEASYPMAYSTLNTTQVFEPILMGVWSTASDSNASKIPNLDSIDFDFDDTNLFSRNRFPGYDRVETGTRLNYGLKWSLYDTSSRSITTLFGQSYRVDEKDDILSNLMGYKNHFSDYVGRFQVDYKDVSVAYRFRLASDDFAVQKNEITFTAGKEILRFGADYAYIKEINSAVARYPTREEILLFASSKFSPAWSVSGYYRYDLHDREMVETGGMLKWENDCSSIVFDASRSFTKDRNYKGETSFKIKLFLKTLGSL